MGRRIQPLNKLKKMWDAVLQFFAWIPWAKLAYTGILMALTAALAREIYRLWWDQKVYLGTVSYYEKGEKRDPQGQSFAGLLQHQQRLLADELDAENQRRTSADLRAAVPELGPRGAARGDWTFFPNPKALTAAGGSAVEEIEFTVQGVNLKDVLTKLRRWVAAPNEVSVVVDKDVGGFQGTLSWPKGLSRQHGSKVDATWFRTGEQADEEALALHMAACLLWAKAASSEPVLAAIPGEEFANWAVAWQAYASLRDKALTLAGLAEGDYQKINRLREYIGTQFDRGATYREYYWLRGFLTQLLPTPTRTLEDDRKAQEDLLHYAVLLRPADERPTLEEARLQAIAIARPVIAVVKGKLTDTYSETWKAVLRDKHAGIEKAAAASGFLAFGPELKFAGSSAAVAPGIVSTLASNVPENLLRQYRKTKAPVILTDLGMEGRFSFAENVSEGASLRGDHAAYPVEQVLLVTEDAGKGAVALLKIQTATAPGHPIVPLSSGTKLNADSYIFAVGYPDEAPAAAVPLALQKLLLGDRKRFKAVIPARVRTLEPAGEQPGALTADCVPLPGTWGAPLLDLASGGAVGVLNQTTLDIAKGAYCDFVDTRTLLQKEKNLSEKMLALVNPPVKIEITVGEDKTVGALLHAIETTGGIKVDVPASLQPWLDRKFPPGQFTATGYQDAIKKLVMSEPRAADFALKPTSDSTTLIYEIKPKSNP